MSLTGAHRGVAETDPRNAGPITFFRPKKPTRESLTAQFAPYYLKRGPEALAAQVEKLLAAIEKDPPRPEPPLSQPLDTVADPVNGLGTHPDIVDHMWALDRTLPRSCRYVFFGGAALVHPETGVVFAVGYGTVGYVMRLPPDVLAAAEPGQLKIVASHGPHLPSFDISAAGPEWRFIWYRAPEAEWARAAYDFAGPTLPSPWGGEGRREAPGWGGAEPGRLGLDPVFPDAALPIGPHPTPKRFALRPSP